uniref:Uncharacterized protein n=1 Tax=Anguilla anguilla TaxID=7936 RepID=A0A0E9VY37_ANGAN
MSVCLSQSGSIFVPVQLFSYFVVFLTSYTALAGLGFGSNLCYSINRFGP